MEEVEMRKPLFIVLLIGLLAPIATAQQPQPADQPALPQESNAPYGGYGGEAGLMEGGYGRGGYEGGYGRGGYGEMSRRGGYGMSFNPRDTRKLVDQWKASKEPAERDRVEKALRQTLTSEFNARLTAHEREIKELEEKVRQLRARLNLRREKQDEIVDHRLQQLLRDAQGLGWGSDEMSGKGAYIDFFSTTAQNVPADPLTIQAAPSALEPAVADDEIEPSSDSAPAAAPLRTP
jgi:hypothetical protein